MNSDDRRQAQVYKEVVASQAIDNALEELSEFLDAIPEGGALGAASVRRRLSGCQRLLLDAKAIKDLSDEDALAAYREMCARNGFGDVAE